MKASIVVPTWNAGAQLAACVEQLLRQDFDQPYEIIISDDGSTDDTPQIMKQLVERYPDKIVYQRHAHMALAENRNIGARAARGEILIFLDADMQAQPGFVQAHAGWCQSNGVRSVTLGAVPAHPACLAHPVGRFMAKKWERRLAALAQDPSNYSLMQGGNFSIWRAFFLQLGGFDKSFVQYGSEDVDFFIRAGLAGACFAYAPAAAALQWVETQFQPLYKKAGHAARASSLVMRRYPQAFPQPRMNSQADCQAKTLIDRLWRLWKSLPFAYVLMRWILPAMEHVLPDRYLFLIYNALLSHRARQALEPGRSAC